MDPVLSQIPGVEIIEQIPTLDADTIHNVFHFVLVVLLIAYARLRVVISNQVIDHDKQLTLQRENHIQEIERINLNYEETVKKRQSTIDELHHTINKQVDERNTLTRLHTNEVNNFTSLMNQIRNEFSEFKSNAEISTNQQAAKYEEIKRQLEQQQRSNQIMQDDLDELRKENKNLLNERNEWKEKYEANEAELEKLITRHDQDVTRISELESQLTEMQQSMLQLQSELNQLKQGDNDEADTTLTPDDDNPSDVSTPESPIPDSTGG